MEREQCRVRPRTLRLEDRVDQVHAFLPAGSVVSLLPEKPGEGKEKNNLEFICHTEPFAPSGLRSA